MHQTQYKYIPSHISFSTIRSTSRPATQSCQEYILCPIRLIVNPISTSINQPSIANYSTSRYIAIFHHFDPPNQTTPPTAHHAPIHHTSSHQNIPRDLMPSPHYPQHNPIPPYHQPSHYHQPIDLLPIPSLPIPSQL